MVRHGHPTTKRCAYTLVEVLIVLAVLAVLAALTWPSIRGMLGKGELRSGAKQVRVALARTRIEAIESGVAQAFRYRPGSGRFETTSLATPGAESQGQRASRSSGALRWRSNEPVEDWLPRGVWFAESRGTSTARAEEPAPPSGRSDDGDWSAPIVFFPNGRSTNARIRLAGSNGYQVEVALRGLTGTAIIGPFERIEDRRETASVGRIGNPSHKPEALP